jgi:glycosyltransferase involved in cell wall biosynthesis
VSAARTRNSLPRVLVLRKRWEHHTSSGGYDRLATHLATSVISRPSWAISPMLWVPRKAWMRRSLRRTRLYLIDYQFGDLLAELAASVRCALTGSDVLHVLYGDEQLDLLLRFRKLLPCPLVATFHLPISRIAHRLDSHQTTLGRNLDGAIVMSRNMVPAYEKWVGAGKVAFIPHGVDTHRFMPIDFAYDDRELRCAVVGNHLRDWPVLRRVVDIASQFKPNLHFDIVASREACAPFVDCRNVTLHSGIEETELVRIYQKAIVAFIPVTDATANNAVLESMACGTPVISTEVGGIPDYVSDESGWLLPTGDAEAAARLLEQICGNPAIATSKRAAARRWALQYDWAAVAEATRAFYSRILK